MFRIGRPGDKRLARLLAQHHQSVLSYSEHGATRNEELPNGYTHDRESVVIGNGRDAYNKAAAFLDTWALQQASGIGVYPQNQHVVEGQTVILTIFFGPIGLTAPARVVYLVDEPTRHGFAYGTLPSHPEIGEEYFGVTIDGNEEVRFELLAFSRPGGILPRLGGLVTRRIQVWMTQRYLSKMRTVTTSGRD